MHTSLGINHIHLQVDSLTSETVENLYKTNTAQFQEAGFPQERKRLVLVIGLGIFCFSSRQSCAPSSVCSQTGNIFSGCPGGQMVSALWSTLQTLCDTKGSFHFLFKTKVNSNIKSRYNKLTVQVGMCLKQNFLISLKTCILLFGLKPSLFLLALPPQGHAPFS